METGARIRTLESRIEFVVEQLVLLPVVAAAVVEQNPDEDLIIVEFQVAHDQVFVDFDCPDWASGNYNHPNILLVQLFHSMIRNTKNQRVPY